MLRVSSSRKARRLALQRVDVGEGFVLIVPMAEGL